MEAFQTWADVTTYMTPAPRNVWMVSRLPPVMAKAGEVGMSAAANEANTSARRLCFRVIVTSRHPHIVT